MRTLALMVALALQVSGPVEFGRGGSHGTSYSGKADRVQQRGSMTTWRGHVTLTFHDSQMVVSADEMTLDANSKELILKGDVRLKLDTQ